MRTLLILFALLLPAAVLAQPAPSGACSISATCKASKFVLLEGKKLCLNGTTCTTWIAGDSTSHGMDFNSNVTNSGTNAAYLYNTTNALSGSTNLLVLQNQGTTKFTLDNAGDIILPTSAFVAAGQGFGNSAGGATQGLSFSGSNTQVVAAGIAFNVGLTSNTGVIFANAYLSGVSAPAFLPAKRTGTWLIAGASDTTFTAVGLPTLATVSGTPTSAAGTADAAYQMIKYASGAVSGNVGGIQEGVSITQGAYGPRITVVFRTDSVNTSQRVFVGFAQSDISGVATLAGLNAIRTAAIRFDTGLSDTDWMCVTSDGTTASATDSGVAFAINTTVTVTIDLMNSGTAYFTINGNPAVPTVSKTTNLPTGSTPLGPQASITTLTTAARNIYLAHFQVDQN